MCKQTNKSNENAALSAVVVDNIVSTLHLKNKIVGLDNQLSETERIQLYETEQDSNSLSDAICLALYNTPYNNADDVYSDIQIDTINLYKLFFTGIGKDHFFMNECDGWRDISSCLTLADYCQQQHALQQTLRFESEEKSTYQFSCGYWVRFIQHNNTLCYANVHSADQELYWILEEILNNFIDEVVPHQWVEGENNNKVDENGFIEWDMRIDANGFEPLYNLLLTQGKLLINQQVSDTTSELAQQPPITILFDNYDKGNLTIVVNNHQAAETIFFRDFIATVNSITQQKGEVTSFFDVQKHTFKQVLLKLFEECELVKPIKT